jgi:AbrB family looped-hinge helix DNA binding protein
LDSLSIAAIILVLPPSCLKEVSMGAHERLTAIVSTKGQITLPKTIRDERHWPAGTRLTVEDTAEGVLFRPVPVIPACSIDATFGSLPYKGPPLSIDDMHEAISREATRRAQRG